MTGVQKRRPFFYQTTTIKQEANKISLDGDISILRNRGELEIEGQRVKINEFVITQYDKNGKLSKDIQVVDRNGDLNVVYMKNYNKFLVLDEKMYNSTYVQLFVLENYNIDLFEPVILTPLSKVYKLKI